VGTGPVSVGWRAAAVVLAPRRHRAAGSAGRFVEPQLELGDDGEPVAAVYVAQGVEFVQLRFGFD